jgi:hypothetical protein
MTCKLVARCRLHQKFVLESTLHFWRAQWCERDYHQCARLRRHEAGADVPDAMLPSGEMLKARRAHVPSWVEALRARDALDQS